MEALQWVYSAVTNLYDESHLNNEPHHLRATLPKARMLISRSQWDMFKNKELAELLSHLKDTTYDAEDLLRELEDEALRLKIEGADRSRAGQFLSCFLNLGKNFVHGSKARIKEAQDKLDKIVAEIEGVLNLMGLMSVKPSQIMPETSSLISAPEVVGRDGERDVLIEMLGVTLGREAQRDQVIQLLGVPLTRGRKRAAESNDVASTSRANQLRNSRSRAALAATNYTDNVSVISIVGIGGVGKTTLAQFIYNDPRVEHHFGVKIWVCVSDFFDTKRITMEIFKSIPREEFNPSSCSLNELQVELVERLKKCQKFLLVLDDIWPNANAYWEAFYAPLRHGSKGSMILVTTRCPIVATRVTTRNFEPVELEGLPTDIFWDFFKKCALGTNDPRSYPHLLDIGHSISTRLCGSPLAAKTLGRLLNMSLTEQHWRTVQKSELWELRHEHNDILPALQLSYLYLPEEVKRCFLFCSMFPKDYSFERDKIVGIWVAQGFVVLGGGRMRPEDVAITYLDELRNRFLFQTDPKFPNKTRYVMHDLIHDMAVSFSTDECLVMQDLRNQYKSRMQNTVRHMSIEVYCESLTKMGGIQELNKLHSLRFGFRFDAKITWFSQLSNILFLSLQGCYLVKLPESICELNSLRYLDISHSSVEELPKKVGCLYNLQFLDASHSKVKGIRQDVTKLINLRQVALPAKASEALSRMPGLGNLSCLQNLSVYTVVEDNRGIGELKFMNQLNGSLCIRSLTSLRREEEAAEARLVKKQYLKELVLQWREIFTNSLKCNSENEVFEGLRPHSGIECIKVHGFFGDRFPSWFNPEDLPILRSLELSDCGYLESSPIPCFTGGAQAGLTVDDRTWHVNSCVSRSNGIGPSAFTRLTDLRVYRCSKLKNLEQFLTPEKLPSIKSITLQECWELASIPVHRFVGFVCLRDLKICVCPKLKCPQKMALPPSLQRLCIVRCNELDMSFPACLKNLTSLSFLQLASCDNVKCIPMNSIGSKVLKCLVISLCPELLSIGGLHALASIQHVQVSCCHKLTEVQLPFEKKELGTKEANELINYLY